jgi:hypothetical protein
MKWVFCSLVVLAFAILIIACGDPSDSSNDDHPVYAGMSCADALEAEWEKCFCPTLTEENCRLSIKSAQDGCTQSDADCIVDHWPNCNKIRECIDQAQPGYGSS